MDHPLLPGILSITFRQLSWEQIVDLTAKAGLGGIEWGGDIHIPSGDIQRAEAAKRRCADEAILISAYGSYYRLGNSPEGFAAVLDTALALGAETIRVWAGAIGSNAAPASVRQSIADDLHRCCDLAAKYNLKIATEFHGGTLTDDIASCLNLLQSANASNARTFWQPPTEMDFAPAISTLRRLGPLLSNVHVFHWWPTSATRQPLSAGQDRWLEYLRVVAAQSRADGIPRFASLEFVKNDDVEQLIADAKTLLELLSIISRENTGVV